MIKFRNKITKEDILYTDGLFVYNEVVYRENFELFESQSQTIGFDDCVEECPYLEYYIFNEEEIAK